MTAHADRPRLRPRLFVTFTPVNAISFTSLNGGWLAWVQSTVSPGPDPHWRFAIHVFDLTSHRLRVLHPPALPAEQYVSSIRVAPPWVAWVQSPGTRSLSDWQMQAYNVATGQGLLVDSARQEGQLPQATPALTDGEYALSGHLVAWTTEVIEHGAGVASVLKLLDLHTRRVRTVARSSYHVVPGRRITVLGWPALDGSYLAWDRTTSGTQGTESDSIRLVDLRTNKLVSVSLAGQASEPALGSGYLAWKMGPRFSRSAGIDIYDLRTRRILRIRATGAGRPSLGTCLVAYGFFDTPNSDKVEGIYDLCHHRELDLTATQETWPANTIYNGIRLAGDVGMMDVNRADIHAPTRAAIFEFSAAHPLYDFYH